MSLKNSLGSSGVDLPLGGNPLKYRKQVIYKEAIIDYHKITDKYETIKTLHSLSC